MELPFPALDDASNGQDESLEVQTIVGNGEYRVKTTKETPNQTVRVTNCCDDQLQNKASAYSFVKSSIRGDNW